MSMYQDYFNLKESPFSITPDPHFLYLNSHHRDALDHLSFNIREGNGFLLLTGEVGTGKTTLCRYLVQQLPDNADIALVFHPIHSAEELLVAACEELGIIIPETVRGGKALLNLLNRRILENHAHDKTTVLIIDEAQNLTPALLEHVRMLNNLETEKKKLLQIILIGQPELDHILARSDLRQLNQRISARFQITALNAKETAGYVRHRLAVAGFSSPLFTSAALRRIYRRSGGVPRLINLICDRAMLGAFAEETNRIGSRIINNAAAEVLGSAKIWRRWRAIGLAVAFLVVFVALAWPFFWFHLSSQKSHQTAAGVTQEGFGFQEPNSPYTAATNRGTASGTRDHPATISEAWVAAASGPALSPYGLKNNPGAGLEPGKTTPMVVKKAIPLLPAPLPSVSLPLERGNNRLSFLSSTTEETAPVAYRKPMELPELLSQSRIGIHLEEAMSGLLAKWSNVFGAQKIHPTCEAVVVAGMRCYLMYRNWDILRSLNIPVVIRLQGGASGLRFALLTALDGQDVTLHFGGQTITTSQAEVSRLWTNNITVLWRSFGDVWPLLKEGMRGDRITWLRRSLEQVQEEPFTGRDSELFDLEVNRRLRRFQAAYSLGADGVVGPVTLIMLDQLTGGRHHQAPRLFIRGGKPGVS